MRNITFRVLAVPFLCSLAMASTPQEQVPVGLTLPSTVDEKCGSPVGSVYAFKEVPGGNQAGALTSPSLVPGSKVSPTFSEAALKAGGKVHLAAIVCKDGSVQGVEIVKAPGAEVGTAAAEAVRQWQFRPAMKDGQAVAVRYMVSVDVKP